MDKKTSLEILKFTQKLIQTPSQNGINSEKNIAKLIFTKLKTFGFQPRIIGPKNHPSVICLIRKPKAKKTIWLESCIDTVSTGDISRWKYHPFEARIEGNKLYGRGAADSKTGVAIFSYLAKELYNNSFFKANIFLGFDSDEQGGNFTGIKKILKYAPKSEVCILGYQGREEISIGARGWLRLKITTLGKSSHTGSRYNIGINAIHKMEKVIDRLLKISFLKKKEKFFEYGPSLNFSLIKGGIAINIVPDVCEVFVDVRFLPSQKPKVIIKEIINELEKIKKEDKELDFKIDVLQKTEAFLTELKHPFIGLLKKSAENVFKKEIKLTTSGAGSVGNLISSKNNLIINGFGCQFGNVHALNEWVNIEDLPKILKIYKNSLIEFTKK